VTKGWVNNLLGHDSITEVGLQLRNDAIHVSLLNTQTRIPVGTVSDDLVNETAAGVYVQNDTTWNDWFRSIAGLREDGIVMDMTAQAIPQNSGNASGSILAPKLSLIFGPWNKTEYFFNAGRGFHSNDARGVIGKIDSTTGTAASPVPALVGSFGEEVGLRTEAISSLQSSMALWKLDSDSELVYSADSGIGSTSPNGASKRYGLEWDNHWVASDWLSLDANLAWTHARYATMNDNGSSGDLIPNAVNKVGLFSATIHQGVWSGGIDTRYISEYPLTQDGSLMAPSAAVTNLRIQRILTRELSIQMDVLNLFNRQYYDIAYAQDYRVTPISAVVPAGITVHPGEPLQFRVTAKLTF
jgi:outer membrane receptor protein involved in Fe transport